MNVAIFGVRLSGRLIIDISSLKCVSLIHVSALDTRKQIVMTAKLLVLSLLYRSIDFS